jgi:lipoprotein-releasing system ATP-binding protein
MADQILSVEHVVREFGTRAKTRALNDVSMSLVSGELVALTGPSGSGKSTLLNLIGLLDRPTSGRVVLGGTDTTGMNDAELTELRARMLGFVFQFHHLLPAFTALENVMLPAWADLGRPSKEMRERAEELLTAVGLADRMNYKPAELSGGQAQRVAIARALSRHPPLILADEPTGNLDTESSNEIFALLRDFNSRLKTTCLIVTHDPRIAERCDRTVTIVDGKVTSAG